MFVVPLQDEFGWGRDDVSLAIAVNLVVYGLAAPFAAAFVERMGARRVMVAGLIAVAGEAALTIAMTSLWQLDILWGIVIGTATGAISIPLSAIVATRWFVRRLGLVTGLLAASFATGNLVFLPLLAWITDGHGWRWAVAIVAITATAIVPVVLVLMREHPADMGLSPYGSRTDTPLPAPPRPTGSVFATPFRVLRQAIHVRDFWLLAGTFFICEWTTNGAVQSYLIPAAHGHGIPRVTAAGLLAVIGVFDIVGSTASGWLTDRTDPRRLLFLYYLLARHVPRHPAVLAAGLAASARRVRDRLRIGLGRDRPAYGRIDQPGIRPGAGIRRVRVGVLRPHVWRGDGGMARRRVP